MKRLRTFFQSQNILSLTTNVLVAFLGILGFWLLTHTLTKPEFGQWFFYLTLLTLFEVFRSGMIQAALIRHIYQDDLKVVGSAWVIGLGMSILIGLALLMVKYFLPGLNSLLDLELFTTWFPLFVIISLPNSFTLWIQQSRSKFHNILFSRVAQVLPFTIFLVLVYWNSYQVDVNQVALAHLLTNTLAAIMAIALGWSEITRIKYYSKEWALKLLSYGKYSVTSVMSSNLLKNSDTLLINWFLGPAAVALYSIPLKIIEIVQILVRSFVWTSLPKMARVHVRQKDNFQVARIFSENVGMLSIFLLPILIGCFIYAESIVVFLGGPEYAEATWVLRVFVLFGLLLPMDRFVGVTLDAINKPQYNMLKTIGMLITNVVFDIVVIIYIGELWAVAAVTVLNALVGVLIGYIYLKREIPVHLLDMPAIGFIRIKQLVNSRI